MKMLLSGALLGALMSVAPCAAQSYDEGPPAPPMGATANQVIPVRDAGGAYVTPNHAVSREETVWHVRAALNVAALGCRDIAEAETVSAYNAMLRTHKVALASADAAVRERYRARHGTGWQPRHDGAMTRVYNFFAQPPAQAEFCAVARGVLAEVNSVPPVAFADFAVAVMPQLEAPFLNFYRAYDDYRLRLAAWRSGGSPGGVVAAGARVIATAQGRLGPQ